MNSGKNILFQLTGSIAAYKACSLISRLVQVGHSIQPVCTASALEFVGKATLEGLTGKKVLTSCFEDGTMMDHIRLVKWADLLILCPATAASINRLAQGLADDLVGAIFLANNFQKPYWIAPAMNAGMYQHPATQAALTQLRGWGAVIHEPGTGMLACGDVGQGRLIEPDHLFESIQALP